MQKFRKKVAEGGAYEDRNEGGPDRKLNSDLRFVERHLLQTDKNTLKMGEAMCKSHLANLLEFFQGADQFMDRIEFCKKSIVKRLEIELPLMDTAFVENMAHTISIICQHAAKDGDLVMGIKRHIDSWIMHQVVRLHCMGELDEHAYQALKVCPPVAASTIYRHLVLGENVRSQSKPKGNQKIAPKTLNTAEKLVHNIFFETEKPRQVTGTGLTPLHVHFLMDKCGTADAFDDKLITKNALAEYMQILRQKGQGFGPDYLREMVDSINLLLNSKHSEVWRFRFDDVMPWFFTHHIFRLLHAGEIDEFTFKHMQKCEIISRHKLFERVVWDASRANQRRNVVEPPKPSPCLFIEQDDINVLAQINFLYSNQLRYNHMDKGLWQRTVANLLLDQTESTKRQFIQFLLSFGEDKEANYWAEKFNVLIDRGSNSKPLR